jgi:hypothetical protein
MIQIDLEKGRIFIDVRYKSQINTAKYLYRRLVNVHYEH